MAATLTSSSKNCDYLLRISWFVNPFTRNSVEVRQFLKLIILPCCLKSNLIVSWRTAFFILMAFFLFHRRCIFFTNSFVQRFLFAIIEQAVKNNERQKFKHKHSSYQIENRQYFKEAKHVTKDTKIIKTSKKKFAISCNCKLNKSLS